MADRKNVRDPRRTDDTQRLCDNACGKILALQGELRIALVWATQAVEVLRDARDSSARSARSRRHYETRRRDVILAAEIAQRLLPLHPARQRSVLDEARRTLGCE